MTPDATLERLRAAGIVAVLRAPSEDLALRMVAALVEGGVTGIEITYSTPNAASVVRALEGQYGAAIVLGMGTLTRAAQVAEARDAGATFVVSPHTSPSVGGAMVASGLPAIIGALSPTEVEAAFALGANVVKLFPASLVGPSYLRSLRGPFPSIPMMPSGGVTAANLGEWLAAGAFAVSAGGELCPVDWAVAGEFGRITERARSFVQALDDSRSAAADR